MLRFTRRLERDGHADGSLTLPLDRRMKGRQRVTLDDDTEAGLFLERGGVLRDGDRIATGEGYVARVRAAPEPLSTVRCDDPLLLARACYHLGNRHVPLQIEKGRLCYRHDPVLDAMLRRLGMEPLREEAPFEPEPGAYGDHTHTNVGQGYGHG